MEVNKQAVRTGHLNKVTQDNFFIYNPRNAMIEVSSYDDDDDPGVVQDLSMKQYHADTSNCRFALHRQSENIPVGSKADSSLNTNGTENTSDIKRGSGLTPGCLEGTAQEKGQFSEISNTRDQASPADLSSDLNIYDCEAKPDNSEVKQNDVCGKTAAISDSDLNIYDCEASPDNSEGKQNDTRGETAESCDKPDGKTDQERDTQECSDGGTLTPVNLVQTDRKHNQENPKNTTQTVAEKEAQVAEEENAGGEKDKTGLKKPAKTKYAEQSGVPDRDKLLARSGLTSGLDFLKDFSSGNNTLRCPECPWAFSSTKALRTHIVKSHKNKPAPPPVTSEPSEYKNTRSKRSSVLYHRPKPFQCTKCLSSFHKRKELKDHALSHAKQNHLRCEVCGLAFTKRKELNEHVLSHDKKQTAYCELCGKTFSQAGNLKIHLRIHTKEKPYACEHCGKCYAQSGDLKTHVRVHTDEKPYLCEFCGNLFHSLSHLGRHSKVHTKEKPYTCKVCGYSFAHAHHLKKHYRIHTKEKPYNCETCGKAFARSDYLKQHIRVHTKEKPYICKICGKGFSQGGSLRLHQRVHARQGILADNAYYVTKEF